jgi:hypothetical protein
MSQTDKPLTPARLAELRLMAETAGGVAIPSVELLALVAAAEELARWKEAIPPFEVSAEAWQKNYGLMNLGYESVCKKNYAFKQEVRELKARLREVAEIAEEFFRVSEFREVGHDEYSDARRRWLAIRDSVLPREGNADARG